MLSLKLFVKFIFVVSLIYACVSFYHFYITLKEYLALKKEVEELKVGYAIYSSRFHSIMYLLREGKDR